MQASAFLRDVAVTAGVAFVVAAVVTYLYGWVAHGYAAVDWETAFDMALILGIVLPVALNARQESRSR